MYLLPAWRECCMCFIFCYLQRNLSMGNWTLEVWKGFCFDVENLNTYGTFDMWPDVARHFDMWPEVARHLHNCKSPLCSNVIFYDVWSLWQKKLTECNWIMQWHCDWRTSVVCFIVHMVDLPCLTNALHFVYGIQWNLTQICTWDEGISSEICVNVVIH